MIIKSFALGELGANCYYVADDKTAVLIDPGFYDNNFAAFLETLEVKTTAILLTHGHFDHICGTMELAKKYNLTVYIGAADRDCLYSAEKNLAVFVGSYPRIPLDANTKVETLVGGESLNIGTLRFSVMALPGHTAGGMGYIIQNALFCGDTAFYGNIGRTDLPTGDFDTLKNSIKKICRLPDNIVLYCGHGESTTVGAEKMYNPYFQFGAI